MSASMSLTGQNEPLRRFLELERRAQNLAGFFDELGQYLVSEYQTNLQLGISPTGENWGRDNPSHRAVAENGQTLIDHGHLLRSMTHLFSATELQVGTNVVYAAIHQLGGISAQGHEVDARPWMGWKQAYTDEAQEILQAFFT